MREQLAGLRRRPQMRWVTRFDHSRSLDALLICVRYRIRREFGSNESRRCMVQRLSHKTTSPGCHWLCQAMSSRVAYRPQFIEQRFRLRQRESADVRVAPAAEIQRAAAGLRMGGDQRMIHAGR